MQITSAPIRKAAFAGRVRKFAAFTFRTEGLSFSRTFDDSLDPKSLVGCNDT